MMKIEYEIIHKSEFDDTLRNIFAGMLKEQAKVQGDLKLKLDRCKFICIAKVNANPAAIGAIKQINKSDFGRQKAGLPELLGEFEWELGYLYTKKEYERRGIASTIVKLLIENYGDGNLMASTEISANPATVKILERNGFRLYGKPWKSNIHDNYLGLFLRFK